jgi:hypothetical protein
MHHESDDFFIENEEVLSRESTLRRKTAAKQHSFTSHDAWRHFNEGVVRRHYMLQSSRLFLCDRCHPQRTEPLSVYEATERLSGNKALMREEVMSYTGQG